MDKNIVEVRLALSFVLAATLICLVFDQGYSLEDKAIPTETLSKKEALPNSQAIFVPMTIIIPDSIAYVFSKEGNRSLDNNSVSNYNESEILGTNMARQGNISDAEASANITASYLHNYLAANVPLNRNLDVIYGNGTRLSHYPPANYSYEEKLLRIYSLFDYLKKQDDNNNYQLLYANDRENFMDVAFSPNNQTIAFSSTALPRPDNTIRLLDLQTSKELFELANCSSYGKMAFSPDGNVIASGTDSLMIRISDCRTGKELKNVSQNGSVELLAFSPDGKILASTGNLVRDTWIPMLWNTVDNTVIGGNLNAYRSAKIRMEGHSDAITDMAFNPNGLTLATSSYDNTTKIWSAKDGRQLFNLIHDGPVLGLAYSPDGKMLATASEDRTARIWDAENGTLLFRLNHSGPVKAIAFDPKPFGGLGWVVATISSGNLNYWQASTGEAMGAIVSKSSPITNVVFSPEGIVAASSKDGLVRLFSDDLFTQISTLNTNCTPKSIGFSPNGTELAILCDESLLIWDISQLIERVNNTNNGTNNEIVNLNNNLTLNSTQMHSDQNEINNYIAIVDANSENPAILLSAFCEKLGIDARIIAEYGASGEVENISENLSSDNLHLYAEADLGKLNSTERNNIEMAVDRIRQRYKASDVYSHINLSTDEIWLNLDVTSQYPGGPFEASKRQMPVYASKNNESNESTNATSIKENEQTFPSIYSMPPLLNVDDNASLYEFNNADSGGTKISMKTNENEANLYKKKYDALAVSEEQYKKLSFDASKSIDATTANKKTVDNGIIHSENSNVAPKETVGIGDIYSGEGQIKSSPGFISQNDKKTEDSAETKSEKTAIPSKHSESDDDDRYKIKIAHEPAKIESDEHVGAEEAVAEAATASAENKTAECASSAPKMMGGDNPDSKQVKLLLKLMGLIAGGFIIIIATAYRGREPPMDDDDFDDIENKRPGR